MIDTEYAICECIFPAVMHGYIARSGRLALHFVEQLTLMTLKPVSSTSTERLFLPTAASTAVRLWPGCKPCYCL